MPNTPQSSFRLSPLARSLLAAIAESMGISLTAALEVIIREAAKNRGISSKSLDHHSAN